MSERTSAIVINQAYWTQRVTGQQRYAAELAERLAVDTRFAAQRPEGFWGASALRAWGWVLLRLPLLARGRAVLSLTSRAPLWCRRHVLVVHDLFVISHPEWFSRKYVWTHAPLLRAQIRTAAAVVAVSQPVAEELRRLRRDRVVVAPNAPSEVFRSPQPGPAATLTEHGVAPGSYFLAVGNIEPRKNLRRLAVAYGRLDAELRRRHPLVLVGGGADIYRAEDIAWPAGTVHAGYVDDAELARLYRDARCVVFVSLAEGFGLPLVEAAAAGTARLLVSDIEVFRWICGRAADYVDPRSVDDIARGLRDQLERTAAPPALATDRFDWDLSAASVAELCASVAGGSRV